MKKGNSQGLMKRGYICFIAAICLFVKLNLLAQNIESLNGLVKSVNQESCFEKFSLKKMAGVIDSTSSTCLNTIYAYDEKGRLVQVNNLTLNTRQDFRYGKDQLIEIIAYNQDTMLTSRTVYTYSSKNMRSFKTTFADSSKSSGIEILDDQQRILKVNMDQENSTTTYLYDEDSFIVSRIMSMNGDSVICSYTYNVLSTDKHENVTNLDVTIIPPFPIPNHKIKRTFEYYK